MGMFNKKNEGAVITATAQLGQLCGNLLKDVGRKDYVQFLKDIKIVFDQDIEAYSTDMTDEEIMKKQLANMLINGL